MAEKHLPAEVARSEPVSEVLPQGRPHKESAAPPGLEALAALQQRAGNRAASLVVQRKLAIGHADDPLETAADAVASELVATDSLWLADGGGATSAPGASAPSTSAVRRSSGGADPLGGTSVEASTERRIDAARSSGQPLPAALRTNLGNALGTDLGRVRIHTDDRADRLSRDLDARAFTTGHDIFFSRGTYQPASREGREVLAHELAHVAQTHGALAWQTGGAEVQRWPFGKKTDPVKEAEKKKAAEEKKQRQDEKKKAQAAAKQEKKEARARHKVNKAQESKEQKRLKQEREIGKAKREELAKQASGGADKTDATEMHKLADQFQAKVNQEKARVQALQDRGLPDEEARDQAYTDVWKAAPPEVRALRPARETPAEQLQRDVDEFRTQYKTADTAQTNATNVTKLGQLLDEKLEIFYEEQETQILNLVEGGMKPDDAEAQAAQEVWARCPDKLLAERPPLGSKFDVAARGMARERIKARGLLAAKAKKGKVETAIAGAAEAEGYLGKPNAVLGKGGKGLKAVSKGVEKINTDDAATVASEVFDTGGAALGDLNSFFSGVFGLLNAVSDLSKLVTDLKTGERSKVTVHDAARLVGNGTGTVNSAAGAVRGTVSTVSNFAGDLAGTAGFLVPGLSIGTSLMTALAKAVELASLSVRLGQVNHGLFEARARGLKPDKIDQLISPLSNLQGVFGKRVEKVSFEIATTMAKLGASILEVVGAAAWGTGTVVGAALKGAASLVEVAHSTGHMIANSVLVWQTQQGRAAWTGKLEGGAEQVQRRDTSMAVDALITAARRGDKVAVSFLHTYDLSDDQIQKKDGQELHDRIMGDIGATEDPKTLFQKFSDKYDKVAGVVEGVGQKGKDVRAMRDARNKLDDKGRGGWWEAKMFLKGVFSSSKFERSKLRTEVTTGKGLHESDEDSPIQISGPVLTGGSFGGIVSIAKGVVLTKTSDEATMDKWSRAVASMSLDELQQAAKAPYHDDEFKAFFANWVEMRLREEAGRKKHAQQKAG